MQSQQHVATLLWLLPDRKHYAYFHSLIITLAGQFGGPIFQPHLTLGKVNEQPSEERTTAGPIELEAIGIFASSVFTKTLFIRFAPAPALESLRSSLGLSPEDYDPHLSLLYAHLSTTEKESLAASIPLPSSLVRFNRLAVVRCPDPTATRADVESWVQMKSWELKGV